VKTTKGKRGNKKKKKMSGAKYVDGSTRHVLGIFLTKKTSQNNTEVKTKKLRAFSVKADFSPFKIFNRVSLLSE
jgi:hypothetical protein